MTTRSDKVLESGRRFGIFPRGFSKETSFPWPLVPAGELVELNYGKSLVEGKRRLGDVPVFGTNGRCGWHDERLVEGPGVILGRKGMGPLGVEWCDSDFWVIDTAYFASAKKSDLDLRYFYYLVKYVGLNHLKDGTSNPSLSRESFYLQMFPFPSLPEQHRIASVLTALDNKVDLNFRMNQTLEATVRAIFKSWLPEEGNMPEGWSVGTLGDLAESQRRSTQPREVSEETPYIGLEHMPRKSIALGEWGTPEDLASGKLQFCRGEILFGKLRPYFHKVGVAAVDGICSTDIVVIAPKTSSFFGAVLGYVSSEDFVSYADRASVGTKMPRARWADMARYPVFVPPETVAKGLTDQIKPLVDMIAVNVHQSRTLAALRDALLPKLLSGEIRVKQAEKIVGEVV